MHSSGVTSSSPAPIVYLAILAPYTLKSLHDNLLSRVMTNRVKIELSANDIIQIDLSSAVPSTYHTPSRGDVPQP